MSLRAKRSNLAVTNNKIAATDAQIDRLVYDLYDLTEEEIKIIEGAGN